MTKSSECWDCNECKAYRAVAAKRGFFAPDLNGYAPFHEFVSFLDDKSPLMGEEFACYLMPEFEMTINQKYRFRFSDLSEEWAGIIKQYCPQFEDITWSVEL